MGVPYYRVDITVPGGPVDFNLHLTYTLEAKSLLHSMQIAIAILNNNPEYVMVDIVNEKTGECFVIAGDVEASSNEFANMAREAKDELNRYPTFLLNGEIELVR